MLSDTQEELLRAFEALTSLAALDNGLRLAGLAQETQSTADAMEQTTRELQALASASREPAGSAVNTQARNSGGGNTAGEVLKSIFTTGLGAAPLVSAIFNLFGASESPAPPAPAKYAPPPRARMDAASTTSGILDVDYGQSGGYRAYSGDVAERLSEPPRERFGGEASTGAAPQITINVQAMDSRSFLDHSDEIAHAVRRAMLNMHPINDVVADL